MMIEHGWVERNGDLVDPTLTDEGMVYFPGLRFQGQAGIAAAMLSPKPDYCEDLPFFYRFGWGGSESREFCAAWHHAKAYVKDLIKRSA
jgi:hypothetical protein